MDLGLSMGYSRLILGLYTGEPRLWDGQDLGNASILWGGFLAIAQPILKYIKFYKTAMHSMALGFFWIL